MRERKKQAEKHKRNRSTASTKLPWWVDERKDPGRTSAPSIALAKELYGLAEVIDFYGGDGEAIRGGNPGSDWVAIACPFHEDRHKSASANPSLGRFVCHGCEVRGDVLDIVAQQEGHGH